MSTRTLVAGGVLALFALPATAGEIPRHEYAQALDAIDAGRWAVASARVASVLRADPTPRLNLRLYGMRFVDYVPMYLAALVAAERGDCPTAIRALNDPATASTLAGSPSRYDRAARIRSTCEPNLLGQRVQKSATSSATNNATN